ncbi:hypothetical protein LY78DRAFT_693718 [Colletotrichum sublineola]|nr:hypothetical protein LY78DRAFT_693718 [Colletotrichum sublineola]
MDRVNEALASFIDSYNRHLETIHSCRKDLANRFFQLEQELSSLIDPVDLRARLPAAVIGSIVLGCGPQHVTPTRISATVCVFSLGAARHGRPFFEALLKLARAYPSWDIARDLIRQAASRRRSSNEHRPGLSRSPGTVTGDLTSVLSSCETPSTSSARQPTKGSHTRQPLRAASKPPMSRPDAPEMGHVASVVSIALKKPDAAVKESRMHDTSITHKPPSGIKQQHSPAPIGQQKKPSTGLLKRDRHDQTETRVEYRPAKKPRPFASLEKAAIANNPTQRLESLLPQTWVRGSVVSATLSALRDLRHDSVLILEDGGTGKANERQVGTLGALVESDPEGGVFIIMPECARSHWTVAVAHLEQGLGTFCIYDSKAAASDPSATDTLVNRLQDFLDANAALDPPHALLKALPAVRTWPRLRPRALQQEGDDDCGVAVLIHVFHVIAGVPVPRSTDWLLWRRLLAAFLDSPDQQQQHLGGGGGGGGGSVEDPILAELRSTHDGILSGINRPAVHERPADLDRLLSQCTPVTDTSHGGEAITPSYSADVSTSKLLGSAIGQWQQNVRESVARLEQERESVSSETRNAVTRAYHLVFGLKAGAFRAGQALEAFISLNDKTRTMKSLQSALAEVKHQGNDDVTAQLLKRRIAAIQEDTQRQKDISSMKARRQATSLLMVGAMEAELKLVEGVLSRNYAK